MKKILMPLFGFAVAITTVLSFVAPDLPDFQRPDLVRIFFWHLPCPILASALMIGAAYMSFMYLRTNDLKFDIRAEAMQELTVMFSVLTMLTGIIFSKAQWGDWWQNDPRQTSFLLVLMIFFAYFAYRASTTDRIRRASNSAGLCLASILPALFLIYVYPNLPHVITLHPQNSILKGRIHGWYAYNVWAMFTLFCVLAAVMYRMRVYTAELLRRTEDSNGLETTGDASAPTGVVRPISLPGQD